MSKISLSDRTLKIISNFAEINTGLTIAKETTRLAAMKATKSVIAVATIPEEEKLANNVAIYNMHEFLGLVGMYKGHVEFEFAPKHVHVFDTQSKNNAKYRYANPKLITAPPERDINMPAGIVDVRITTANIKTLADGANRLGLENLRLCGKGGEIYLEALTFEDAESNTFKVNITETYAGPDFEAHYVPSNLTFVDGSYMVTIHHKVTRWVAEEQPEGLTLTYFVALESSSSFPTA